jgi:S1-C subfamily serine protease
MTPRPRPLTAAFCLSAALATSCVSSVCRSAEERQHKDRRLIAKVTPAIAAIHREPTTESSKQPATEIALSTAAIVHSSGILVTSHSATREQGDLVAVLADGRRLAADIVHREPAMDLVLLQLKKKEGMVHLPFANSDKLELGQFCVHLSHCYGLTAKLGIVSAKAVRKPKDKRFLQCDAAVSSGYGRSGPLIDMDGRLIGYGPCDFPGTKEGARIFVQSSQIEKLLRSLDKAK